jgi:imidazolonepropionase-like amidohydrolase
MASGGGTLGTNQALASYTAEEIGVAVREAQHVGKLTTAHCLAAESLVNAIEGGIDQVEHINFIHPDGSRRFDPQVADHIVERGISLRFLAPMVGRMIDGVRLAVTLQTTQSGDTGLPGLLPDPNVPAADRDRARTVAQTWLAWYASVSAEPADAAMWVIERMEYEFAVAAATPTDSTPSSRRVLLAVLRRR